MSTTDSSPVVPTAADRHWQLSPSRDVLTLFDAPIQYMTPTLMSVNDVPVKLGDVTMTRLMQVIRAKNAEFGFAKIGLTWGAALIVKSILTLPDLLNSKDVDVDGNTAYIEAVVQVDDVACVVRIYNIL